MSRTKVLQVLEWFELGGGMEAIAAQIACGLDPAKYDVEIWCVHRGGKFVELVRQKGVEVKVFNITTYHNPLNILKLAKAFKEAKADIVHTHGYFASTIGRIAAKLAGVPVCVNHVHSSYWEYSPQNLFIERFLSAFTQKIICVSDTVRDFVIQKEKIDPLKIKVIYNGISPLETNDRLQMRKAFKVASEEIIITAVGSLFENKGHKILFKALSLLKDKHPHIKCWIVGEGPMEKELKEMAGALNLGSVIVFLSLRDDVPQLLSASDLFVLASVYREGMPVSILEAMGAKLPVIASRIGGVPELIDDRKNGLLVLSGDAMALAGAIEELILDKDKRLEFASKAYIKFKEQFNAQNMIAGIERIYQEFIKK